MNPTDKEAFEKLNKILQEDMARMLGVKPEDVNNMSFIDIQIKGGLISNKYETPPYEDDPRIPPNFSKADRIAALYDLRRQYKFLSEN